MVKAKKATGVRHKRELEVEATNHFQAEDERYQYPS